MEKILEALIKEIDTLDNLCAKIWGQRYDEAKHQDIWYDKLLKDYTECRIKIKTYSELLTPTP